MSEELKPYQIIKLLCDEYLKLSDEEILAKLEAIPVLPDEDNIIWDDDKFWNEFAYPYIALADAATVRKLRPAVKLLLERACFGDPGEIMRGLMHNLEGIVNRDWSYLAEICLETAQSPYPGARLWSIHELLRLRGQPDLGARVLPILLKAVTDEKSWIRSDARHLLVLLCSKETNHEWYAQVNEVLTLSLQNAEDASEREAILKDIKELNS